MLTRIWAGTGSSNVAAALGSPGRPEWTVTVVQNEPAPGRADLLKDLDERELVRVCLAGQREAFDVIVEDRKTAQNGEMVIALLRGAEVTLKKLYRENGAVRLQPANPAMQPLVLDAEQVQIQGVVVGVMRKY